MKWLIKTKCQQARAFTLIELLVVIAIISLLVSILLPSLNQAKDLAKKTLCMTQVRSLGMAMNLYADENNDKFIVFYRGTFGSIAFYISPAAEMAPYLGEGASSKIWICPADDGHGWKNTSASEYYKSYAANGYVVGLDIWPPRSQLPNPTRTLLFSEDWTGGLSDKIEDFIVDNIWDQVGRSGDNAQLHFNKSESSCAFVDGHVEYLDYIDMVPDPSTKGMYNPEN